MAQELRVDCRMSSTIHVAIRMNGCDYFGHNILKSHNKAARDNCMLF